MVHDFFPSQTQLMFHISGILYIPSQALPGVGQVKRAQEIDAHWLLYFLNLFFIGVKSHYNVVLVSAVP